MVKTSDIFVCQQCGFCCQGETTVSLDAEDQKRLQHSLAGISLLILGDLNALTPADDHVDVAGIVRGNPDNRNGRLHGRDLVQPDLVDLSLRIPAGLRYSFVFRRQNQQLDYMLVNRNFAAEVEYIGFGAIDRGFSDHAGLLARFAW